jgi:hypothetical protein
MQKIITDFDEALNVLHGVEDGSVNVTFIQLLINDEDES